ncbi:ABC transporter substrate-binding protein [Actinomadura sp. NBRC 104412]|uniref:FtsX-like permease family protein n=1 Tax=Actinomadura sp. NBRC 104412 TaxID=3032203 RepID=UPI0024A583A8|nr:FtsX-like permease family protein [Actinomadura sp. NBRC 104412]GLZ02662.1 ABC transporter substrate-binding protein [Actinomadura sp. NBRC 104412]
MGNAMWLIARRSFTDGWARLIATLLAALGSIALIAGSLQFALRAQEAVAGSDASEYARADVLVHGGTVDPDDPNAPPDGRIRMDAVASRPGVAAVAGDATVAVTASRPDGRAITASAEGRTLLRPWVPEPRLNPYRLEAGRAPTGDGEVAVVRYMARAGKVDVGDALTLTLPRETRRVRISGIVTVQGRDAVAAGNLVLAPPQTVRGVAGLPAGTWQAVWVKAAAGVPADRLRGDLARELGGAATVRTAASVRDAQSAAASGEGASIASIIGMLASVAIFVGLFVVANTFGTLVRQRTRRLALLGAIGATPRQIGRLIRLEALVLGAIAAVGGVAAGFPVSALITRLFARDGFDVSAAGAQFGPTALALPAAAGIVVTQLAAWRAARRAAGISPLQALRSTVTETPGRRRPRLLAALVIFLGAGFWLLVGTAVRLGDPPGTDRTFAVSLMVLFGSMLGVTGLAVLGPFFVAPLGGLVGRAGRLIGGETGRLAHATITRSPRRVSSAASSLMLGVALVAAVAMVTLSAHDRFRDAGRQVMAAEHAITATARTSEGAPAPVARDVADRVAGAPGVSRVAALTRTQVRLVSPAERPDPGEEEPEPLSFLVTGAEQSGLSDVLRLGGRPPALRPGEIALSSAIMEERGLRRGQRIVVRGAQGRASLTVADAYHDPSHLFADQALVAPATMDRLDANAATQVVLIRGGSQDALARAVATVPGVRVVDRDAYVDVASRTLTRALRATYGFVGMALLLALFGMATTVSMSVAERTREFGLLGAVGTTMRQIRSIVRWEAATVVVLGTTLGIVVAMGMLTVLHVMTGSSFVRPAPPWWLFPMVAAGAAAVTLVTSALPARRAASVPVLEATRSE